jgi:hypothetical protein
MVCGMDNVERAGESRRVSQSDGGGAGVALDSAGAALSAQGAGKWTGRRGEGAMEERVQNAEQHCGGSEE